jgi:hypothetical protein
VRSLTPTAVAATALACALLASSVPAAAESHWEFDEPEVFLDGLVHKYTAAMGTFQITAEDHPDRTALRTQGDEFSVLARQIASLNCEIRQRLKAEAALASACLLGSRFSIIAISRRISAWYRESVEENGLIGRLASIRSLDAPVRDIGAVQSHHAAKLHELCAAAVEHDGADVIIVAGAPLAGLARTIARQIPVPLVDGVSSAVRHAESLAALRPGNARAGSYAPAPAKPNAGLPEALRELLRRASSGAE